LFLFLFFFFFCAVIVSSSNFLHSTSLLKAFCFKCLFWCRTNSQLEKFPLITLCSWFVRFWQGRC
jgi:hypothetical protein